MSVQLVESQRELDAAMQVVEAARRMLDQTKARTPHLSFSGENQRIADAIAALDSQEPPK